MHTDKYINTYTAQTYINIYFYFVSVFRMLYLCLSILLLIFFFRGFLLVSIFVMVCSTTITFLHTCYAFALYYKKWTTKIISTYVRSNARSTHVLKNATYPYMYGYKHLRSFFTIYSQFMPFSLSLFIQMTF